MWALHLLLAAGLLFAAVTVLYLALAFIVGTISEKKEKRERLRREYAWTWEAFPPVVWDGERYVPVEGRRPPG